MSRGWPFLFLLLACPGARAAEGSKAVCPPDVQLRRALGVERTAPVACHAADGQVQMAAIVPRPRAGAVPHVIAAISYGGEPLRGEADLAGTDGERLPADADDWKITIDRAGILGADWLRVNVTAATGEDLFAAQTVVSFFKGNGRILRHLWTGLGDRHEARFDACRLDTVSEFRLSEGGALVRTRRTTRTFVERTDLAADDLSTLRGQCVATPQGHDTFAVADDGVDADFPVSKALRAQGRENRRLFLRARRSPEDLGRFIVHSMALIPELEKEVMDASPTDPERNDSSISISGAQAFMMDSSGRSGLDWKNIVSVAGPRGRALVRALTEFRGDDGVWISPRTDYGGCHQPEQATGPLRRLVTAWNAAPAVLRDAFEPVVTQDLREMSTDSCFCDHENQRAKIQRALDRNAAMLERLSGLSSDVAAALRGLLSEKPNFNCSPG